MHNKQLKQMIIPIIMYYNVSSYWVLIISDCT